ncbi:hypothetical protein EYF80_038217 [Liparis tanakae]|uniref:Uncharacterized protein n=1 Tax=Liparis tanakae TaxID=230148 RepID=A0A4Z2GDF6_9TELE|nr:hypothetical protein EYF80_038217 [Liparis tanakae]
MPVTTTTATTSPPCPWASARGPKPPTHASIKNRKVWVGQHLPHEYQQQQMDYRNDGGLCTEETTPTHESPPPPFPLTTRRQQPPIAALQPALHDPYTLLVPDDNHPFIPLSHNKPTMTSKSRAQTVPNDSQSQTSSRQREMFQTKYRASASVSKHVRHSLTSRSDQTARCQTHSAVTRHGREPPGERGERTNPGGRFPTHFTPCAFLSSTEGNWSVSTPSDAPLHLLLPAHVNVSGLRGAYKCTICDRVCHHTPSHRHWWRGGVDAQVFCLRCRGSGAQSRRQEASRVLHQAVVLMRPCQEAPRGQER